MKSKSTMVQIEPRVFVRSDCLMENKKCQRRKDAVNQALHSRMSPERAQQIGDLAATGAIDAFPAKTE